MKYLILSQGEEYAKELSTAMWLLSRPHGEDATKHYVDWSVHADGRAAVSVPGEAISYEDEEGETAYRYTEDQPIHKDCDAAAFRAVIDESVTPEEADAIEAGIEAAKGSRMSFLQVIIGSPSLLPNLKTKAELEADGWFPNTEIL